MRASTGNVRCVFANISTPGVVDHRMWTRGVQRMWRRDTRVARGLSPAQAGGDDPDARADQPRHRHPCSLEAGLWPCSNGRKPDEGREDTDHRRLERRGESWYDTEQHADSGRNVTGPAEVRPRGAERQPRGDKADRLDGIHEMRQPNRD